MQYRSDGNILDDAIRFGAKLRRYGNEYVGPCPECGGDDRFAVNVAKGVFNCRGCGVGGGVVELARHIGGMSFAEACAFAGVERTDTAPRRAREDRWQAPPREPDDDNHGVALALWRRRQPVADTPAEVYVRHVRAYTGEIPQSLGFLPASGRYSPCLIAAFAMPSEPECGVLTVNDRDVLAVQLTPIKPDGTRGEKRTLGRGALGVPIAVATVNDGLGLVIVEGLESGLSVRAVWTIGVWAAAGKNRLPALAASVPAYVENVLVLSDDDADGGGQRYARELGDRLTARGISNQVKRLPPEITEGDGSW